MQICPAVPRSGWSHLAGQAALLVALAVGQAHADTGDDTTFAQIDAAISRGDPAEAEHLADAALAVSHLSKRDESVLLSDRALARNLNGETREALADYTKAIGMHALPEADQITALLERGLVLEMLNRLRDALNDYGAVLKLAPNSSTALNRRANVFRRLGQLTAAQRDFLASLAANNTSPEHPYYGLGQIAEAQGDPAAARNYYGKALAANPDFAMATEALGHLNASSGAWVILHPSEGAAANGKTRIPRSPKSSANTPVNPGRPHIKPQPNTEQDHNISLPPLLRPAIAPRQERAALRQAQLGAWRSEGEAAGGWANAMKLAGNLLAGIEPSIIPAELPQKGRFFRLRISLSGNPQRFCEALRAKGVDCIPVAD